MKRGSSSASPLLRLFAPRGTGTLQPYSQAAEYCFWAESTRPAQPLRQPSTSSRPFPNLGACYVYFDLAMLIQRILNLMLVAIVLIVAFALLSVLFKIGLALLGIGLKVLVLLLIVAAVLRFIELARERRN